MASPPIPAPGRTAVFTIVSRNYLHYARALMGSVAKHHPRWDRFVLLADRLEGALDPAGESFQLVEAQSLPLPQPAKFFFRYTILELNTAVKPWFFRDLFARGYDRVVYLDPDILVFSPLAEVERALSGGTLCVLVPHLTGRLRDGGRPSEHDILQSGAYNLGFCALARHPQLDGLLDFWCEKSERDFAIDLARGLFTDQRWMDLVPGMFPDVEVLRHEGYDVAYWNLPHRVVRSDPRGGWQVNGVPLVFFHFSGLDPAKPQGFSKHQNRYRLDTLGPVATLVQQYCDTLRRHGLEAFAGQRWAYGALDDGTPIPDVLRRLHRGDLEVEQWAGDAPFALTHAEWNAPLDEQWPPLTRPMLAVYSARPDLRVAWPHATKGDRLAFARWFVESASTEVGLDARFVEPIRLALEHPPRELQSAVAETTPLPRAATTPELLAQAARKAIVAAREGRLPTSPRRWLQLYRLHLAEHAQQAALASSPPLPPVEWTGAAAERGLSIVGYLEDGTGVAAGAHASAEACGAVGLACELLDARPPKPVRGRFAVNLLHVNADQTPIAAAALGKGFFDGRYTIGVWAWETDALPDAWLGSFDFVDEVWAPSRFIQEALADKSPVPVVHVPHCVTVAPTPGLGRRALGLPEQRFLFLMKYDVLSIQERKNPLGALQAFRTAFPNPRDRVGLVVQVNHAASRPEDLEVVRRQVAETPGAVLLERPFTRPEAQALVAACDAYVSLHRAEGFGLNIAEAMLLGRPVVVTGWSGNLDFTDHRNACLVNHEVVTLAHAHGPYLAGSRWAEPDPAHAASWMRRLFESEALRRELGERARATLADGFSPRAIGERYLRRLEVIRRRG